MNTSHEVLSGVCARTKTKKVLTNRETVTWSWLRLLLVAGLALSLSSCKSCGTKGEVISPEPPHPVAECRELAPEDPYEDDEEGAEIAYAACFEAAQLAPDDVETLYRLGTSAFQTKRMDEAVENFRKAEHLGYCNALYFLGEDAWYGQKDADRAEDYYKRGAACGDERAAAEIFSPKVFERSARPEIIEALYNSDMQKLNKVRFVTASYVAGFYEALCEQYQGKDMDTCWKANYCRGGEIQNQLQAAEKGDAPNVVEGMAYEWLLPKAYQVFVPGLGSQAMEEFRKSERLAGSGDELRMVESSKCGALLPHRIVTGLETFAKTKRSLVEVGRTSSPNIRSVGDLTAWLQQQNPK
jgi:tetratricopeptide (TPR) repeat protein